MRKFSSTPLWVGVCFAAALFFPRAGISYIKVDDSGCLACHAVGAPGGSDGLHGLHSSCNTCHDGAYEKGSVAPSACAVCHPFADPGKCGLVTLDAHGTTCTGCHADCEGSGGDPGTTTTIATQPCFAEELYGEDSEEAALLRAYRDGVLVKTPEGRRLIGLYYKWSPVISRMIEINPALRKAIRKNMDALLPAVRMQLELQ